MNEKSANGDSTNMETMNQGRQTPNNGRKQRHIHLAKETEKHE